jgi:hypothetical protein
MLRQRDQYAAGQKKEGWRVRKLDYIEHLKTVDREALWVAREGIAPSPLKQPAA